MNKILLRKVCRPISRRWAAQYRRQPISQQSTPETQLCTEGRLSIATTGNPDMPNDFIKGEAYEGSFLWCIPWWFSYHTNPRRDFSYIWVQIDMLLEERVLMWVDYRPLWQLACLAHDKIERAFQATNGKNSRESRTNPPDGEENQNIKEIQLLFAVGIEGQHSSSQMVLLPIKSARTISLLTSYKSLPSINFPNDNLLL